MKLYIVEWDGYSLMSIHYTKESAEEHYSGHFLEDIREVDVIGEIVDNKVYAVVDGTMHWIGICASEYQASHVCYKCKDDNYYVEMMDVMGE